MDCVGSTGRVLGLIFIIRTVSIVQAEGYNCTNYIGSRPYIFPLNTAQAQYDFHTDVRSSSIKGSDRFDNAKSTQFNCSYNQPIHWVFHLDLTMRGVKMNTNLDFFERIIIPYDESDLTQKKYSYSSNFELKYYNSDLKRNSLFSCEPTLLTNPCERNFIQIHDQDVQSKPTETPDPILNSLSEQLYVSSAGKSGQRFLTWNECPLKLHVKVVGGNVIYYFWDALQPKLINAIQPVPINETTYFHNVFRLNAALEPNCVKLMKESEICSRCQLAEILINDTINAMVFYAKYKNTTMVFKGHFSVPQEERHERQFFFDFQVVDSVLEDHMIQLIIPDVIYANNSFQVKCRVSKFLFAYGTVISDRKFPKEKKSREIFSPFGYREVVRSVKFSEGPLFKNISCFAPLIKSNKWVQKSQEIFIEQPVAPAVDNLMQNTTVTTYVSLVEAGIVAECNASGNPKPLLTWIHPINEDTNTKLMYEISNNSIRIIFPPWEFNFAGTYICEARSFLGVTTKTIIFKNYPLNEESNNVPLIVIVSLAIVTVILGTLIGLLLWKIRRQRLDFEIQTQKAIEEFKNGLADDYITKIDANDPNLSVMQLPYNESFEIHKEKWDIEDKILGSGQFGIVRMGSVAIKGNRVKLAVKTLKCSIEIDEFRSFLFELKIMAYLGQHKNIVSLVAACTEGINDRDILIGVEFCDNGCLLDYLRKYQAGFSNMVTEDGKITSHFSIDEISTYSNISLISTHDLFRWAYHIACGMEYLRIKKCLHGDLAARNVLLTARKSAKVGDFGLSRFLMNSENYTKQSNTALPWKWMALESLQHRVFNTNTDKWSYGITLHELFTIGQSPYPGISWSPDFITRLADGMRMDKPTYCTTSIYKVMKGCWELDPNLRPTYASIKRKLSKGLRQLSILIKNQQEHRENAHGSISTTNAGLPEFSALSGQDEFGVYTNMQRRTMNYYKN